MHKSILTNGLRYFISSFLGSLLLLLTAFPYLQLIPSDSYTQPFALILGAALFFIKDWPIIFRIPRGDQAALIGLAFVGVFVFVLTCFPYVNFQEYKYLISYIAPMFLTIPLLGYVRNYPVLALRLIKISIWTWIVVAVIQKFLDPNFLGFLIGQWSEGALDIVQSGRGVLGLAPEPTHHAFHILLLAACLILLDPMGRSHWLLLFCIIDAVMLAASSSALLVLGMASFFWSFIYRQRWLMLVALTLVIALGVADQILSNSDLRVAQLISMVLTDPFNLLNVDYSMNARLGGMIAVFLGVFSNALIPFGMSLQAWEIARENLLTGLPWLIDLSLTGPPSGIGMLLFQTGALGAAFIGLIFRRILISDVNSFAKILLIASPLIFLGQYYISAPTLSLLYAVALFRIGHKNSMNMPESYRLRTTTP